MLASLKKRSSIAALIFLALVALVAVLKPPSPHAPYIGIDHPAGYQLRVFLPLSGSLDECQSAQSRVSGSMLAACPECKLIHKDCVAFPGPAFRKVQMAAPLPDYSLRFSGGDIVFKAKSNLLAKTVCMQSQAYGVGRCFEPGERRYLEKLPAPGEEEIDPFDRLKNDVWKLPTAAFTLSLFLSLLLVLTKTFHGRFTFDKALGVQSFHTDPTPRIGGLALFVGFLAIAWWGPGLSTNLKDQVIWPVVLASLPAFLFGLAEDVTRRVGTTSRLIATMASALIAWWLMGVSLRELDVAFLDPVLAFTVISVIFTVFAVGGIANAINIIDGFHGLASGVSIILFLALGAIAYQVGDFQMALLCGLISALIAGFFLVNFPFGRLFLGDGGAYFVGFLLGWVCVLLPARNPEVSPWACLLVCAYPVTETLFSIYRRAKTRLDIDQPDREHLHSLLKQVVITPLLGRWKPNLRNAAVSPMLWLFTAITAYLAVKAYSSAASLAVTFVLFFVLYVVVYTAVASRLTKTTPHSH